MAMTLNNTASMAALGTLNKNVKKVGAALAKIASGDRIPSAKYDSAGLAMSEILREQLRSLHQDQQNVQNGSAMFQTAAGGIDDIIQNIRRLKELAINAANDSNSDIDRVTIQKEIDSTLATIEDVAVGTEYNGIKLLDGTFEFHAASSVTASLDRPDDSEITIIPAGDYTIQSDGVYELAGDYTGTITVASNAANVEIRGNGGTYSETYIVGNSSGDAALWLNGVNIVNEWQDKPAIDFSGANNALFLIGSNSAASQAWNSAGIHIGEGLIIADGAAGSSLSVNSFGNGAGIGTNQGEQTSANLILSAATVTSIKTGAGNGAAIGTGEGASIGDIIINANTTIIARSMENEAAAIGTGKNGDIKELAIYSRASVMATAKPTTDGRSPAIGGGVNGNVDSIHIYSHSQVQAFGGIGCPDIGIGAGGYVQHVHLYDEIQAGIGSYQNQGLIFLIGGHRWTSAHSVTSAIADEVIVPSRYQGNAHGNNVRIVDEVKDMSLSIPTPLFPDGGASSIESSFQGNPLVIHHGTKSNQMDLFYINSMRPKAMDLENLDVKTRDKAEMAIGKIDKALDYALDAATDVGSYMARLEHTASNLEVKSENTALSDSVLRDADMAKEMTEYTKFNVLTQSAQAMLAQAGQNQSQVLSLLQ